MDNVKKLSEAGELLSCVQEKIKRIEVAVASKQLINFFTIGVFTMTQLTFEMLPHDKKFFSSCWYEINKQIPG
jgi:hypothetical protein